MDYKYVSVFVIGGLSLPQDQVEQEIIRDADNNLSVYLTRDIDRHCFVSDQGTVIANRMLDDMFGGSPNGHLTLEQSIPIAMRAIQDRRRQQYGSATFLVVVLTGEVGLAEQPGPSREHDTFVVGFDLVDSATIRDRAEALITDVLTSLALGTDAATRVEKVTADITLFTETQRPVYSFTSGGSARAELVSLVSTDELQQVARWFNAVHGSTGLSRVAQLLVSSLEFRDDSLRAFLFAWFALEIFIREVFGVYKTVALIKRDSKDPSESSHPCVARLRTHFGLADKFELIACLLAPADVGSDLADFNQAKADRNRLAHGEAVVEERLPARLVQTLLRKYLRLHLQF